MEEKWAVVGQPGTLFYTQWFDVTPDLGFAITVQLVENFSCFTSPVQVYYYQDVKCRDEMYDKDVLMLQVGGSQALLSYAPRTVFTGDLNVFTDSCYQNGPQPLPHVALVEIRAL